MDLPFSKIEMIYTCVATLLYIIAAIVLLQYAVSKLDFPSGIPVAQEAKDLVHGFVDRRIAGGVRFLAGMTQ